MLELKSIWIICGTSGDIYKRQKDITRISTEMHWLQRVYGFVIKVFTSSNGYCYNSPV